MSASALALIVIVVMVMMMMSALALLIIVMMVMMSAFTLLIIVMVMMVSALALIVIVVMVMMMMSALAFLVVIVVMMMVMSLLLYKLFKLVFETIVTLHCGTELSTVKLVPRRSNYYRFGVLFSYKLYCLSYLFVAHTTRMAEYYRRRALHLIYIELTEVLYIHLALTRVANGSKGIKNCVLCFNPLNRAYNVGKLTYSRRLYEYSVGLIFVKHLFERLTEVADKTATDTA